MKKLLGILVLGFLFCNSAIASTNCQTMLKDYVPNDKMIKLAHLTKQSLNIYINNIRNMKDVDIVKFGFTSSMSKLMEDEYKCPETNFIKSFESSGLPININITGKSLSQFENEIVVEN